MNISAAPEAAKKLRPQVDLFSASPRMEVGEAMELTVQSLAAYGRDHNHWVVAWSGGKDSTATLTLLVALLESGELNRPESLTVLYADTRQELPPLYIASLQIIDRLKQVGIDVRIVTAPIDKRFLVYILGRGVPPPNNNTLRWCTRQIKIDPMTHAVRELVDGLGGSVLMITGVRQGESAIRDRRIEMSCSKDGAECGQGWYQKAVPESPGLRGRLAVLAPLLHWRVCLVWDWLQYYAPLPEFGGWPTRLLADAYGGDEAEEINARTGCIACPLASKDTALETIMGMPGWAYLHPLLELRGIYRDLRLPQNRLRKSGVERLMDGTAAKNPQRMGPITLAARGKALAQVLDIQHRIQKAAPPDHPKFEILNAAETDRIRELISAGTWPNGWDGNEPVADTPMPTVIAEGIEQSLLF